MSSQNPKKRWIKSTLIVLFSVAMLCVVCYQLFTYNCLWLNCAPKRDFTLWDLGIPPAFFPPHTLFSMSPGEDDIFAEELYGGVHGIATYMLKRYATQNQASNWFVMMARSNEFTDPPKNIEELSDILDYQSLIADDFLVECGYSLSDFRCIVRARYQEYFIFFSGSLDEDKMTKENFLGVMMFIDFKMDELLGDKD